MKNYIILFVLLLLSSCDQGINEVQKDIILQDVENLNIENEQIYIEGDYYDSDKIEYVHKRGWKETIYDNMAVLKTEPDFTEKYYTINEPKSFFDENEQKIYYIVSGDTLLIKEQWEYHIKQQKESIKNIRILSQGDKKFILYKNSISKLSDFEKSWNITFNLGKYKTITIPE